MTLSAAAAVIVDQHAGTKKTNQHSQQLGHIKFAIEKKYADDEGENRRKRI